MSDDITEQSKTWRQLGADGISRTIKNLEVNGSKCKWKQMGVPGIVAIMDREPVQSEGWE